MQYVPEYTTNRYVEYSALFGNKNHTALWHCCFKHVFVSTIAQNVQVKQRCHVPHPVLIIQGRAICSLSA